MKFSERKGLTPVSKIIQTEGMNDNLRISIWNVLDLILWPAAMARSARGAYIPRIIPFGKILWFDYFKKPIDTSPAAYNDKDGVLEEIREYFFKCEWYEVYNFLEFTLNYFNHDIVNNSVNEVLEREIAGYRFVGGVITDITAQEEVKMLEGALADQDFPGVKAHLQRALELLSNRKQPDYRNSIKESISAVESLSKEITGNPKASLSDALKTLEHSDQLHPALSKSFSNLYGYTSDEEGIRHAMLEEPNLSVAEAKFFLLSCTSFINYMKSKL